MSTFRRLILTWLICIGDEVYVYVRGRLVSKRWLAAKASALRGKKK